MRLRKKLDFTQMWVERCIASKDHLATQTHSGKVENLSWENFKDFMGYNITRE